MIGGWTVGVNGECFHDQAGFPLGTNGYKRVALQVCLPAFAVVLG